MTLQFLQWYCKRKELVIIKSTLERYNSIKYSFILLKFPNLEAYLPSHFTINFEIGDEWKRIRVLLLRYNVNIAIFDVYIDIALITIHTWNIKSSCLVDILWKIYNLFVHSPFHNRCHNQWKPAVYLVYFRVSFLPLLALKNIHRNLLTERSRQFNKVNRNESIRSGKFYCCGNK